LNENGIFGRVPAVKEFLSDAQKAERLAFAEAYGDRSQAWWNSVIFSDEKTFG
jgi:hypothetical protein